MTAKCSRQALGLPGMLTMSVRPRSPAAARLSMASRRDGQRGGPHRLGAAPAPAGRRRPAWPRVCGRAARDPSRRWSAPGRPSPPSASARRSASIWSCSSGTMAGSPTSAPRARSNSTSTGPDASARRPAWPLSLTVTTAARMRHGGGADSDEPLTRRPRPPARHRDPSWPRYRSTRPPPCPRDDLAAVQHPHEDAFARHHAVAGLIVDGAAIVAHLADLGDFDEGAPQLEARAERQAAEVDAPGGDVLGEVARRRRPALSRPSCRWTPAPVGSPGGARGRRVRRPRCRARRRRTTRGTAFLRSPLPGLTLTESTVPRARVLRTAESAPAAVVPGAAEPPCVTALFDPAVSAIGPMPLRRARSPPCRRSSRAGGCRR